MDYTLLASLAFAVGLFLGMLVLLEVGRRIGIRRMAQDAEGARAGVGAIDGAVFALMGLLIAFTFSGAASRFDSRRQLIVEETNAIGTAYLRLDLLPTDAQPVLRDAFRRYVDSRLETYHKLPDIEAAKKELARSLTIQNEIWTNSVSACKAANDLPAMMLLVPALNEMIDITTTQTMAGQLHPPMIIFVMLAVLVLASSLLAGYEMGSGKTRNWIHMIGFAAILAVTVYVILDLEFPRMGVIRIDAFDQAMVELRASMR